MTDNDSLMDICYDDENIQDSDEDEHCLYIDENVFDSIQQQPTKSTNTGNPFELDLFFIINMNRYQTRSSQTILTSNLDLLFKRHRSTICQAEYFSTKTQETNTNNQDSNDKEERIPVFKKQRTENIDLLLSQSD